MSISPGSEARGLERLIWLKYCVQTRQITFTFEMNAVKNSDYMEKSFK